MLIISRDMLSLLRDKEKRHKLPDIFEILFHFPLLLNTPFVPPQTLQRNSLPIVRLSQPPVL